MRFALAAVALVAAGPALAQPAKERVITVTGSATVYAKPDTARVHYGARISEPAVDAAKDSLGKTTKAMDEAVKKLKMSNVAISAAPVTIRQVQANANALAQAPGGAPAPAPGIGPFSANAAYTATITDPDPDKLRASVEAFVKAVTEAGANTPGDDKEININVFGNQEMTSGPKVLLSRSDESATREQALQKAVERAMKDAKAIAKGLGGGEVTVVSVAEGEAPAPAASPDTFAAIYGMEARGPMIPAGEIEVKVRVVLKCSY